MPPKGSETNQPAPEHPQENKGLLQKLKDMLTGGNPDNTPEMKAELEAARAANNAPQEQAAADKLSYMQGKVDSGEVPVVTQGEIQAAPQSAVETQQNPENPQNPAV